MHICIKKSTVNVAKRVIVLHLALRLSQKIPVRARFSLLHKGGYEYSQQEISRNFVTISPNFATHTKFNEQSGEVLRNFAEISYREIS
jgi:hypothetical protein